MPYRPKSGYCFTHSTVSVSSSRILAGRMQWLRGTKTKSSSGKFLLKDHLITSEEGGEYASFLSSCDETTDNFEDVMLRLLGIGLSQVRRGANGVNFHKSADTYEKLSE